MSSTATRLSTLLFAAAALAATVVTERAEAQGYQYYAVTPCRIVDTRYPNPYQPAPRNTTPTVLTALYPPVTETWWPGPYDPLNPVGIKVRLSPLYDGTGSCGVPTTAAAVSLNASMISGNTLGYFNMWPSNAAFPTVATMIVGQGETVTSNGAIVPLGTYSAGNPDMYVRYSTGSKPGSAHLTLDVTGYFAP
jgi:hypothetical protein